MGTSSSFEKVGECLNRNPSSGTYYSLVKVKGKQVKWSLKTATDKQEVKRKLGSERVEKEATTQKVRKTTGRQVIKKYLETIQNQADSTRQNKEIMLGKAEKKLGDTPVRNLKKNRTFNHGLPRLSLGKVGRISISGQSPQAEPKLSYAMNPDSTGQMVCFMLLRFGVLTHLKRRFDRFQHQAALSRFRLLQLVKRAVGKF